jgi:Flp pilus assembly protein TadB
VSTAEIVVLVGCWVAFATGTWMLLVGRRPGGAGELSVLGSGAAVPSSPWHELIEGLGSRMARLWALAGQHSDTLEADLAVLRKTPGQFYGERVAGAFILAAWVPAMRLLGVHIPMPVPWSIGLGAAAFFVPSLVVRSKAEEGRRELRDGVAEVAVLMSLAVSSGAGVDAAFRSALEAAPGRFAGELARARYGRPRGSVRAVIDDVADRLALPEASTFASAVGATEHGAAVGDALDELAWAMVEERRIQAKEVGVKAGTRMVVLGTGLMVPGYMLLIALPAVRLALTSLKGG